ncbi:methionyl-tRNA formyltransferase [uncultured Rikenella sp.]|uniref:methionyl-tRNA formyltransferase n=1 Tax=uncultured Rikenella sp. TaxID=368003 RepID=UPI00261D64A1|nr:methionyl-tRNA formyltransferase [uncultured Rikenella sp.]
MEAKQLRIVYMGTPDFAVEPLRRLVEGGYRIVGVVTVPDKPAGRGLKMQQSAVKRYAEEALPGVPLLQPVKLKDPEFVAAFEALEADLAVVVAFRMLPEVIWAMPRLGTFNLHASLLPQYRGAAPINWAVMNGERKTGVTTFLLDHEIDTGAILMQRELPISDTDTAGTVHDGLMELGAGLVVETVEALAAGTIRAQAQLADGAGAGALKPAPKIFKEDCRLVAEGKRWGDYSTRSLYDKVRGLSPYPGAWCDFPGSGEVSAPRTTAKILAAHGESFAPGEMAKTADFESDGKHWLRVACADGWLYVDRLQVAGKRAMEVEEFLRGYRI